MEPLVARIRRAEGDLTSGGLGERQLYVAALAQRDRLGELDWEDPDNADATCC